MSDFDLLGQTSLPLDEFRNVMGISPYHFWQMTSNTEPSCYENVTFHYPYSGDGGPGRLDYLMAIDRAEQMLAENLGWWPGLRHETRERVIMDKPRLGNYAMLPASLHVKWGKVQGVGKLTWDALELAVDLDYTGYGIGADEVMASLIIDEALEAQACEIIVTYSGTTIPIRPTRVVMGAGGVVDIYLKRWLCGDYSHWAGTDVINPDEDTDMAQTVDVYRVWMDPSEQIILQWKPGHNTGCTCGQTECAVCGFYLQSACATPGAYEYGIIGWQPAEYANATWNGARLAKCNWPDFSFVSYAHGDYVAPCNVSNYWASIISHMAVALLPFSNVCGCPEVNKRMAYYQEDLSFSSGAGSHMLGMSALENPFGTQRGCIEAWRAVLKNTHGG